MHGEAQSSDCSPLPGPVAFSHPQPESEWANKKRPRTHMGYGGATQLALHHYLPLVLSLAADELNPAR